VKDLNILKN
jgi:hypothetical protein